MGPHCKPNMRGIAIWDEKDDEEMHVWGMVCNVNGIYGPNPSVPTPKHCKFQTYLICLGSKVDGNVTVI
jgi:hypothetical protein